jgi:hypothetical protein
LTLSGLIYLLKNDLKKGLNIHVSYLFKFSRFKLHREVFLKLHDELEVFLKLHDELIFSRFKFAFLEVHDEVLRRENQFSRFRVFAFLDREVHHNNFLSVSGDLEAAPVKITIKFKII